MVGINVVYVVFYYIVGDDVVSDGYIKVFNF